MRIQKLTQQLLITTLLILTLIVSACGGGGSSGDGDGDTTTGDGDTTTGDGDTTTGDGDTTTGDGDTTTGDGDDDVAPMFTSTPVDDAVVGELYEYTLTASGTAPLEFTIGAGPDDMAVDEETGEVTWTPTEAGEVEVTFGVVNAAGDAVQTFIITVEAAEEELAITSAATANGVRGKSFSYQAEAEPSADVEWTLTGTLPDGLDFDALSGIISGTPTEIGGTEVTLEATSPAGTATLDLTITVTENDVPPVITSAAPAQLLQLVDTLFTYTATADSLIPVTFSLVDAATSCPIAPAISIGAATGLIEWTPSASGDCTVTIHAASAAGDSLTDLEFTIEVGSAPAIAAIDDFSVVEGDDIDVQPVAAPSAGVTFALTTGPSWASIDTGSGNITGTAPTATGSQTFVFAVTGTNAFGTGAPESFTLTVDDLIPPTPAVLTSVPSVTSVVAGQVFAYSASATGVPLPIAWALVSSPSGMTVTPSTDGTTAEIAWTSSVAGTFPVTIQVDNDGAGGADPGEQTFDVTVYAVPPNPGIDTTGHPASTYQGAPFTFTASVTAPTDVGLDGSAPAPTGTFVWSLDVAPDGMTVNTDTGVISWTPADLGSFSYTLRVTRTDYPSATFFTTIPLDVELLPVAPTFTSTAPITAVLVAGVDTYPGYTPSASGVPAPTITAGGLPAWMSFSGGNLTSTSPIPLGSFGTYNMTLTAANGVGANDTQQVSLTVIEPPPTVSSITPAAARNQANVPVTIRGLSFSLAGGAVSAVKIKLGAAAAINLTGVAVVDASTITATVPADIARAFGVYDVIVVQSGVEYTLPKRLNVTAGGDGTTVSANITIDQTWTAIGSPYRVTGTVEVLNGATLTIAAGATVIFGSSATVLNVNRIDVGVNGTGAIIADGGVPGVGNQIVFTAYQPVTGTAIAGGWGGIRFGANSSVSTLFKNVVVEFGGRSASGANGQIEMLNTAQIGSISDCILRESERHGLYVGTGAGNVAATWFDNNLITRTGTAANQYPVSVSPSEVTTLGAGLSIRDNTRQIIQVRGGNVNRPDGSGNSLFRTYPGVTYQTTGTINVEGNTTLQIAPGNTVRFPVNARIEVGQPAAGGLSIDAASNAVTLTSADSTPGQEWQGIVFRAPTTASTLRGANILNFNNGLAGGVRLIDPTGGDTVVSPVVTIDQSTISTTVAATRGVYLDANARLAAFTNNTVSVTGESVSARGDDLHTALSSTSFYNTEVNARGNAVIETTRNPLASALTWQRIVSASNAPAIIRIDNQILIQNTSLTIAAGSLIQLAVLGEFIVSPGQLIVAGTAALPVTFRSTSPGVGYWRTIQLNGDLVGRVSEIRYAKIEDGGYDPATAQNNGLAAVRVTCNGTNCSLPIIANSNITRSRHFGLLFADGAHCNGLCTGNVIDVSRFAGVQIFADYVGRFGAGNSLQGNNTAAVAGLYGVWVRSDNVQLSATWPALALTDSDPYYSMSGSMEVLGVSGTPRTVLTLAAGAQVRFPAGTELRVGRTVSGFTASGNLVASGTPSNKVVLTSLNDGVGAPTYWRGVYFEADSTNGSTLTSTRISYGGSENNTSGNVIMMGANPVGSAPVFTNVELTNSVSFAGSIRSTFAAPSFSGMTYQFNDTAGAIAGNQDCIRDAAGVCTAF